jgi:dipeptidyl aminopeptidase/acylaminoacyl peptidase
VKLTHIPYKGTGPALIDTIAGNTTVIFGSILPTLPHVRSGRLRGLAVTTAQRVAAEPNLPTIAESGLPGYEVNNWNGLIAPRGSSGRGFDFSRAIYADWGSKDVQDVLAGVDHVVALGIADPDRLGVGGWSYGSILTNAVIASDTRFKAAVSGAGASNMYAMFGHDQYIREYELELGAPWKDRTQYDRASYPFLHADRIKTPTLFQCGEKDFNVPCLGAEQMYQALRSLDVPTELVVYPGENHGLTVPSYLRDRLERNLAWYERFLKP